MVMEVVKDITQVKTVIICSDVSFSLNILLVTVVHDFPISTNVRGNS
jgi:hypothetical protein